ncbi:MAG TPA: ureidoglycolate lyase, partial [Chiayiivirga sp.]|nr:ureidoglycolate lyase [Chiayiivirga sp.]
RARGSARNRLIPIRHPLGSQAFVPLHARPWLVVVAASPEAAPRAFLARDGAGVNFRRGTWHHPLLALEATGDFLVVDRIGPGDNCEEAALAQPWLLALEQAPEPIHDTANFR